MMNLVKRFFNEESGQGMTEYGLIVALIAVVLIGVLVSFKEQIAGLFDGATTDINTETGYAPKTN